MLQQLAVARYQQVVQSTSTPGELLLELYAGLFRFLRAAKKCLEDGRRGPASELITKSHAIVSELDLALDHSVAPELCRNLTGIYGFCLDRLMLANRKGSAAALDEVIRVLTPLHEAWLQAVPEAVREQGRADAGRSRSTG